MRAFRAFNRILGYLRSSGPITFHPDEGQSDGRRVEYRMTMNGQSVVGTISRESFTVFSRVNEEESASLTYQALEALSADEMAAQEAVPWTLVATPVLREIARNSWGDTEVTPDEESFYQRFYLATSRSEGRNVDWEIYSIEHAFEEFCVDEARDMHP